MFVNMPTSYPVGPHLPSLDLPSPGPFGSPNLPLAGPLPGQLSEEVFPHQN